MNSFAEIGSIQNAEDYHLWIKLLLKNNIFYGSEKILASYIIHKDAATSFDKKASSQIPEVFADLGSLYPHHNTFFYLSLKQFYRNI